MVAVCILLFVLLCWDWLVGCLVRLLYLLLCSVVDGSGTLLVGVGVCVCWVVWMVCLFVCFDMVDWYGDAILVVVFAMCWLVVCLV